MSNKLLRIWQKIIYRSGAEKIFPFVLSLSKDGRKNSTPSRQAIHASTGSARTACRATLRFWEVIVYGILSIFLLTLIPFQSHAELRDPTRPAYPVNKIEAMTTDIEKEPQLSAIWILHRSRWATINGIQAKQGQTIVGNIKIVNIRKNAVIINQNGTLKTLQLLQRPYKSQ